MYSCIYYKQFMLIIFVFNDIANITVTDKVLNMIIYDRIRNI